MFQTWNLLPYRQLSWEGAMNTIFKKNFRSYSPRVTIEQLEERIVLDASVDAITQVNQEPVTQTNVEQPTGSGDAPEAQNAPTQAAARSASQRSTTPNSTASTQD